MQEGPSTTSAAPGKGSADIPLWSRSIGTMKKCQLSGLVCRKTTTQSVTSPTTGCMSESKTQVNDEDGASDVQSGCESGTVLSQRLNSSQEQTSGVVSVGLAGLGAYTSSSGSDNDDSA